MNTAAATLQTEQQVTLLALLKNRFLKHMNRHEALSWTQIEQRILIEPQKLFLFQRWNVPVESLM